MTKQIPYDLIPASDLPSSTPGAFDSVVGVDESTGAARRFPMPVTGAPKAYETRADLPSSASEGTAAYVNNDPAPENNGLWAYLDGEWVQSADRVTGLEGRVAVAEVDAAIAAEGVNQLLSVAQTMGYAGALAASTNGSAGTYAMATPLAQNGRGIRYRYRANVVGTLWLQILDRSGDTFTVSKEREIIVSATGERSVEFLDLTYSAGQYLGVRVAPTGAISVVGGVDPDGGWYYTSAQVSQGGSFVDATATTTTRINHGVELLQQAVTAQRFEATEKESVLGTDIAVAGGDFAALFRIINPFRPYGGANQRPGAVFDFRDRGNLFQDAAGTVPVTGYGQPVGLVRDKAGTDRRLFQSNNAARPIYQIDAAGEPCLYFDGAAFLDSNITEPSLHRTQLFVTALTGSTDREHVVLSSAGTSSTHNGIRHSYSRVVSGGLINPFTLSVYKGSAGALDDIRVDVPDVSAKAMIGLTWDGTTDSGRMRAYLNGAMVSQRAAAGTTTTQTSRMMVGRLSVEPEGAPSTRFTGRLYGLMLYSDLMSEDEVRHFSSYFGIRSPADSNGGAARGLILAAADSPESVKDEADVVCSGLNDHADINAALAAIKKGQRVYLSEGQFNVGGTVVVPDGKGIIGAGKAHTVIKLQDAGSRSLTNYWWRTGAVGADVIMTTAFVDDATRTQYQARDMELRNFTIVGNTDAILPSNANLIGLMVTSCADTVVSDVDVNDINWHEPSAIDPTKGFGIITRYCDGVDIIRCNPKRAQYECLGMFDNSNNTRFIDCYPQDAGRTVTQVHRGCVDSWIIRGHSRNTAYMRLADEQTKALTVHGVPGDRIVNLRVIDHDATCAGVGTGTAIDWFGEQQDCSFSGNAYSQNGSAATFSGNVSGAFKVSGKFTSDSVGTAYTLTLRGFGVRASSVEVVGAGCRGLDLWTAQDIKISDFSILASDNGLSISNLEGVEIISGEIKSAGLGLFSNATVVAGRFNITNVSVETVSNFGISLAGAVADGEMTMLRGLDIRRADNGVAVRIHHSKATLEGSKINGTLRLSGTIGTKVRFNQYSGIEYVSTTDQDNVVEYNLVTS